MSDRKPSPFPILLNNDVCSLIQAAEDVYQIRFKNRAANAYLVRGKSRTIMIDVGLSSNYPALLECLHHVDCPPDKVDIAKINGASKTVIVTLGKGEFFGEMAVIDGSSRSATAIAAAPNTRVMRINHARFVYLVSQQPAFALMIMDALSKRLRASNAVTFKAANP